MFRANRVVKAILLLILCVVMCHKAYAQGVRHVQIMHSISSEQSDGQ